MLLLDLPSGRRRPRAGAAELGRPGRRGRRAAGAAGRARGAEAAGHAARRRSPRCPPPSAAACCGRSAARPSTGTSTAASGSCCRASRAPARPRSRAPPTSCAPRPAHLRILDADGLRARLGRRRRRGARHRRAAPSCSPTSTSCPTRPARSSSTRWSPTASPPTPTGRGWSPPSGRPGLSRPDDPVDLLEFFPRTVEVPPLRHHVEDVAELVPHLHRAAHPRRRPVLLARGHAGAHAQPVAGQRRAALPGAAQDGGPPPRGRARAPTTCRRRCGRSPAGCSRPLEAIECDAIVDALLDNDGNKAEAARQLGMSRATIYRKIRGYGITVPDLRRTPAPDSGP